VSSLRKEASIWKGDDMTRSGISTLAFALPILFAAGAGRAQTAPAHCAHHAAVEERGDRVMGFDHEKTTHHFRLTPSGGAIEVTAKDGADTESRDAIRSHLSHIAGMFAEGDFEAPMLVHGRMPPGAPAMHRRKDAIRWQFEEIPSGGRIRVTTADSEALSAVHEFLRFQIEDHQTGDSPEMREDLPPTQ
jgi:hypothetical protein